MEVIFLKSLDPKFYRKVLKKSLEIFSFSGKKIGVKTHFGEEGNRTYIPPVYAKITVEILKELGAEVALVETTTLYRGKRHDALSHINLAYSHGFTPEYTGAPILILDGFMGDESWKIESYKGSVKYIYMAKGLRFFDGFIFLNHFKGHILTGFGGAIKNMSMGLSSKKGKMSMHKGTYPWIEPSKCTGCGECSIYCPTRAIKREGEVFKIVKELCIGCGGCISVCKYGAVKLSWGEEREETMKRMVDYALFIKENFWMFHVNFLMNITRHCDCFPSDGHFIMKDMGVLFSMDPVMVDHASLNLTESALKKEYPHIDMFFQLEYGKNRNLGNIDFKIKEV